MTVTEWIALLGLVGLGYYCIETRRIRITNTAQLEALQAPCLTFAATPRNGSEAILDVDGAHATMVLDFDSGDATLKNIGCGPAVNIAYSLVLHENPQRTLEGYVPFMPPSARATIPVARNSLQGREAGCVIRYESLSQTKYETRLAIDNLVLRPPFLCESPQPSADDPSADSQTQSAAHTAPKSSKEGANVKENQFQFLMMLVSGMGAIVIGELLTISSRLKKIYDAIGVWGTSIESGLSRLRH